MFMEYFRAKLKRGEFLDESIKVYPLLTDVSNEKLEGITEYADILKTDVPIISIPKTIVRTKTSNGLYVDWNPTEVIDTQERDKNLNRKLYFKIGGSEDDVNAFWEDVWSQAEKNNVDLEALLEKASEDPESSSESDLAWRIVPAKFFLEYMIGANTLIVTFDRAQVEDSSALRDPMFFNLLNNVLPSGMRLFFVEHVSIDNDDDIYDLDDQGPSSYTEDKTYLYAYEDIEDEFDYSDLPGMKGKRIPTYEDQVELKLYRNRKRSAD